MVSRFFSVPDGRGWRRLGVGPLLVGHRLGEFVKTRAKVRHYRKKRAKAQEKLRKEASKAAKAKATGGGAKPAKPSKSSKSLCAPAPNNSCGPLASPFTPTGPT
jgi:hypothetical protein